MFKSLPVRRLWGEGTEVREADRCNLAKFYLKKERILRQITYTHSYKGNIPVDGQLLEELNEFRPKGENC